MAPTWCFCFVAAIVAGLSTGRVDRLVVFGDSMSDNGINPPDDNHGLLRLSDGPVWNEYLAASLGLKLNNYACGGAKSGKDNRVKLFNWAGISYQVDRYLDEVGGRIPTTDLIAYQMGGGKDILPGIRKLIFPRPEVTATNNVGNVVRLIKSGVKMLVVMGIPPVEKLPKLRILGTHATSMIEDWVIMANDQFGAGLNEVLGNASDVSFRYVNMSEVYEKMVEAWMIGHTGNTGLEGWMFMSDKLHMRSGEHRVWAEYAKPIMMDVMSDRGRNGANVKWFGLPILALAALIWLK